MNWFGNCQVGVNDSLDPSQSDSSKLSRNWARAEPAVHKGMANRPAMQTSARRTVGSHAHPSVPLQRLRVRGTAYLGVIEFG